jgi:maleylpyruvate isomerase
MEQILHAVRAAHQRLIAGVADLTDSQIAQPSLLPNWNVGHVLSHIALNAEAFVNVAAGLANGEVGIMYPTTESRDEAINQGATRTAEEIRAHIKSSCAAFDNAWQHEFALDATAARLVGTPTFAASEIPLRRLREVEVHHADADLTNFSYCDMSEAFVTFELTEQLQLIGRRSTKPLHLVDETGSHHHLGLNAELVQPIAADRRSILAWSMNRIELPGLSKLGDWQHSPTPK